MSETIDWTETNKRELDALIAEKVFGRVVDRSMTFGRLLMFREGSQSLTEELPDYTTDMNDAMLIVQHLNTSVRFGYSPAAERYEPHVDHNYCEITLCDWPEFRSVQAYGKTLPEAICVAALREKANLPDNFFVKMNFHIRTDMVWTDQL